MHSERASSLLKIAFRSDPASDLMRELKEEFPQEWNEAVEDVKQRRSSTRYGSLVWEEIHEPAACPLRRP